ncbi:hypothetical protein RHMOL_Rhmol13G0065000 [Rhododendron molle]|uniref:Uncharacterized protein n=1 Tax=Rhododendron molle TaxID=49168 RepID=A0ACC0L3N0_RHOML|nr:hypothetical protein RHMOL_Rhmol13G0065000 [Rhododendron molle]
MAYRDVCGGERLQRERRAAINLKSERDTSQEMPSIFCSKNDKYLRKCHFIKWRVKIYERLNIDHWIYIDYIDPINI